MASIIIKELLNPFQGHHVIEDLVFNHIHNHHIISTLAFSIMHDKNHETFDVKKLILKRCKLTTQEYDAIVNIIAHSPHLKIIKLFNNDIEMENILQIMESFNHDSLVSFSLSDNWIGEEGAKNFAEALSNFDILSSLDVSIDWLGDAGARLFAETLKNMPSLKKINLSCNDIHLSGTISIMDLLRKQHQIKFIDMSYNVLNSECARQISLVMNTLPIEYLDLRTNQIGNEGAFHIAKALKENKCLKYLNLSDNKIGIKGVKKILESALYHNNLIELNLAHNVPELCNDVAILLKDKKEDPNRFKLIL